MSVPDLYGLVLTGGRSRRMQRDKAGLEYAGQSQLERAMELLTPLVTRCFVSGAGTYPRYPQSAELGKVSPDRVNHRDLLAICDTFSATIACVPVNPAL